MTDPIDHTHRQPIPPVERRGDDDLGPRCHRCWVICGALCLGLGHMYLMLTNWQITVLYPWPTFLVIVGWITGIGTVLVTPILFYLASWPLALRKPRRPTVFPWLALGIAGLNTLMLAKSWDYGLEFQGETHTTTVTIISALTMSLVVLLVFGTARYGGYRAWFAARWLFFLWPGWMAFPYLGEMP